MNKYRMLMGLLLILHTPLQADKSIEDTVISPSEISLLEQSPHASFAYIPDPVRALLLDAHASHDSSEPMNHFWSELHEGARIVRYDELMQEMPLLTEYFDQSVDDDTVRVAKKVFFTYKKWLENGEALITLDDVTRSRCKTIHRLIVKCKLIAGCLHVCGDISFGGKLIGPSGIITGTTGSTAQSNYLAAYSTATQVVAVANTFQTVTFSTVTNSSGWTTVGPAGSFTGFLPSATGIYQVTYTASAEREDNPPPVQRLIEAQATLGGSPIAGSQMHIDVSTNKSSSILSNSFQVTISPAAVLAFQIASDQINSQISGESVAGSTVNPSITVTISQIK